MFKVGIIGPESCGKTTLAQYLAKRYGGEWVPEYAREYVEQLGRPYTYEDVKMIAIHQIEELAGTEKQSLGIKFYDTELIVTKVWFDYEWGHVPIWLEDSLQKYPMDVYLLVYPDLPWVPDPPARVNGSDEVRKALFDRYEQEIQALDIPYYIIKHC